MGCLLVLCCLVGAGVVVKVLHDVSKARQMLVLGVTCFPAGLFLQGGLELLVVGAGLVQGSVWIHGIVVATGAHDRSEIADTMIVESVVGVQLLLGNFVLLLDLRGLREDLVYVNGANHHVNNHSIGSEHFQILGYGLRGKVRNNVDLRLLSLAIREGLLVRAVNLLQHLACSIVVPLNLSQEHRVVHPQNQPAGLGLVGILGLDLKLHGRLVRLQPLLAKGLHLRLR
mmetsp:Transcript_36158/g.94692  ORF Transcript_36158/g.94692 Transcript_36158/m.94692 type:complete len:228 (-) Transcript_36158:826-1509(-)